MDESGEARAGARLGMIFSENRFPLFGIMPCRLDRAPAEVVAEIAAGVARGARIDATAERGAQQFRGVRAEHHGVGLARDRSLEKARMFGVGPNGRDGVPRAGLGPP